MEFILAREVDLPRIMEIVDEAKSYFKGEEIDQWQDGYPNEESLREDMAIGSLYVLKDDENILGLSAVVGRDPNYELIHSGPGWLSNRDYLSIHRMAVDPAFKGGGLGSFMFEEIEKIARERHIFSLRVDTHRQNMSMRRLIEKNGYRECGIINLANGDERIGYEKLLDD